MSLGTAGANTVLRLDADLDLEVAQVLLECLGLVDVSQITERYEEVSDGDKGVGVFETEGPLSDFEDLFFKLPRRVEASLVSKSSCEYRHGGKRVGVFWSRDSLEGLEGLF